MPNSSNKTPVYRLNQWELTDKPRMADFNYDNQQIELALVGKSDRINAVATYSGGTFRLTAAGTLSSRYTLSFRAPEEWNSEDFVTLNGTTISLIAIGSEGNPPASGAFSAGDLVSLEVEGSTAFFKMGGGSGNTGGTINLPSQTKITVSASDESATVNLITDRGPYFAGTLLVYKEGSTPLNTLDGTVQDVGTATSATIEDLENGSTYHIRAFAYNRNLEYQTDITEAVRTVTPIEPPVPVLSYTGSHNLVEYQPGKFYARLLTNGTLYFNVPVNVDAFLVGGGGSGSYHGAKSRVNYSGGNGGGGGYTTNRYNINITSPVVVTIGAGGVDGAGKATTFGALASASGGGRGRDGTRPEQDTGIIRNGGNGGSGGGSTIASLDEGGYGGTNGGDGESYTYKPGSGGYGKTLGGGLGQGTSTQPFEGDMAPFNSMLFAGGGGSATDGPGGGGGGGKGGSDGDRASEMNGGNGIANTGGGGGGGEGYVRSSEDEYVYGTPGSGGSGIVIVRWGDWNKRS
jgi:hypothetical protein